MEEYENENSGITLGYIFRTIFSQKWLALIVALAVTVVGALGLYFLGNKDKTYTVSFVSKIPGSENSPQEFVFPDGKEFRYEVMVSYENLEKAKASSTAFGDIDIKKMYEKGDIAVSRELKETVEDSKQYEATYKLSAKTKYFETDVIARDFLSKLAQFPNDYFAGMKIDYDRSLDASRDAIQYDKQLQYLSDQVNFLNSEYGKFIEAYNGNFVVKDEKTLNFYQAQLQTFLDKDDIGRLENKALENHYVKSDANGQPVAAALAKYEADLFELKRERTRINSALDDALKRLSENTSTDSSVILTTESVISYTMRLAQIDQDIDDIEKFINSHAINSEFEKEVQAVDKQVEDFTKTFAEIATSVYNTKTTVEFLDTKIVDVEGGRGILMSGVIGLVAGIVVAAIVAYIVGWSKQKKAQNIQPVGVPYYGEAQLQIAASDQTTADEEDKKE